MSDRISAQYQGLDRYCKIERLGSGLSHAFKAKDRVTGKFVALKKILLDDEDEGVPSYQIRRISIMRTLQHPNIVKLLEAIYQDGKLYLVFEFLDQDLHVYMNNVPGLLKPNSIKSYMYQLLKGVCFCHSRGILHRDLKPQNLRIDQAGILKISAFSLARSVQVPVRAYTHLVVTLCYRAPELLLGCKKYSTPVDMWSIGCIFAELMTKRPLFPADSEIDGLFRIFRVLGTPDEHKWPGVSELRNFRKTFPQWKTRSWASVLPNCPPLALDLMAKMMVYEPNQRISARAALQHPYFTARS